MTRTAEPTFEDRSAELTLIFWGGTTATGTLMGQVRDFSWTNSLDNRDSYRIGDSTRYRTYTASNVEWSATLYEDDDIQEVALIMGTTIPTAGGWVGTENIGLSTTQTGVTITLANYDGETTDSSLLWVETLTTAKVESASPPRSGNEVNVWNFSGSAATVALTPSAGTGA